MKNRFIIKVVIYSIAAFLMLFWSLSFLNAQELYTPQGVRILQNKSYDDSEAARQEILNLYKDLRVTDVLDGMDLIGLQDIGLMDNDIRPLWRDPDKFTHRVVGFAVTVRYVPSDTRTGVNSFNTIEDAKVWKSQQYGRAGDAGGVKQGKPGGGGVRVYSG